MKRSVLLLGILLAVVACSPANTAGSTTTQVPRSTTTQVLTSTTTPADLGFPVTVIADNGDVTIGQKPEAIISLSSVATEMLYAIGAGPQVVAVDDQSNYPEDAPTTDLSGFTPNLEAILSFDPDLVVITFDPGDLIAGLESSGVPVLSYTAAATMDDVYRQIDALGAATGNIDSAANINEEIESDLTTTVDETGDLGQGVTYYHEIDNLLYTVTSHTFFGEIYAMFGMLNIADRADEDGSAFGYPQLSSEYVVAADPDIIFLADVPFGESIQSVGERPGWDSISAVKEGNIVELKPDIASRWGPRIVDFAAAISGALEGYSGD